MEQTFSFTEDLHDISDNNPTKGINLFSKNSSVYFLRDEWLPGNYNISELKKFTYQLKRENSVLILGINNKTFNEYNETFNKFENKIHNNIYDIYYTIDDLDKFFEKKNLVIKNDINFSYYKNIYISKYESESELKYDPKDIYTYQNQTNDIIGNNSNIRVFYFKRDTSFKIPKVFITIYFYHPFMRPKKDDDFNNERFFELMLYMSYIKREINLKLADAIRAKNSIIMDFNQNVFYISIFAYSDIAYLILENIKNITMNIDEINSNFDKYLEIYRESALQDFLNFRIVNEDNKMRMAFYENLYNKGENVGIYNYYKFPTENYTKNIISKDFIQYIIYCVINAHIYGYIESNEAKDIYILFDINEAYIQNFNQSLEYVDITKYVNSYNFTKWMNDKNNLKENKIIQNYICNDKTINKYRFLHWSEYNSENRVISYLFDKILNEGIIKINNSELAKSIVFSQKEIYLQFNILSEEENDEKKFIDKIEEIFNKKKSDYNTQIDVVGDRLYYLIKNFVADLESTHEDMQKSAITRLNSNTNYKEDYKKPAEMKNKNYDNFLSNFKNIYKKEFHIDFICSKRNDL